MTDIELIHTPDGRLQVKDPLAPFFVAGTRVRIIRADPGIDVYDDMVGWEGYITEENAKDNKYATKVYDEVWFRTLEDSDLFCTPDMLEIIN